MNEQEIFQVLKNRVLIQYRKTHPYFQGNWTNFSSKDIRQLIDLIETELNERVSEKWIYTHLKPESNDKLPRKDMLDIFSRFTGYSNWNEFVFKNQLNAKAGTGKNQVKKVQAKRKLIGYAVIVPVISLALTAYLWMKPNQEPKILEIKNKYTQEPVNMREFEAYKLVDGEKKPVEITDSKIKVESDEKIVVESPYYENQIIEVGTVQDEILLMPEDYALVLKRFMESGVDDWQIRKKKLHKILSDDLEVIILLKDNLGAEYLNKEEFSEKLIVPTTETRKMKIVDLKTNEQKQLIFIRIQQL